MPASSPTEQKHGGIVVAPPATVNMNVAVMFAGVVILATFGVLGSGLIRTLQRRIVFWEGERNDGPLAGRT